MRRIVGSLLTLTLSLLLAADAFCQLEDTVEKSDKADSAKIERKKPGHLWFHKPAKQTPAEQLAYAQWLEKQPRGKGEALKQYSALVHEWHEVPEAAVAQLALAKLLENLGHHRKAFDEFQYLIEYFAGDFPYDDVLARQFRIAEYVMTSRYGKFLFFKGFLSPGRALPLFKKIVENAPNWKRAPEAQYLVGVIQEGDHDYEAAVEAYEKVMTRYPESEFSSESEFRRAICLYHVAAKSPRDERSCRFALMALSRFLSRYPDSKSAPEARTYQQELQDKITALYYERAVYYDEIAKRPEAALIAYRDFVNKCPSARQVPKAKERIEKLSSRLETGDDSTQ